MGLWTRIRVRLFGPTLPLVRELQEEGGVLSELCLESIVTGDHPVEIREAAAAAMGATCARPPWRWQHAAVEDLMSDPACIAYLRCVLELPPERVSDRIYLFGALLDVLAQIPTREAVAVLAYQFKRFRKLDDARRLAQAGTPLALEALAWGVANCKDTRVKLLATGVLPNLPPERQGELLLAAISSDVPEVCELAANILLASRSPQASPLLSRLLIRSIQGTAEKVAAVLSNKGTAEAIDILASASASEYERVRNLAVKAMQRLPRERALVHLKAAISSDDSAMTRRLIRALAKDVNHPDAGILLINALRHNNCSVRADAAEVLGERHEVSAAAPLVRLIEVEELGWVRRRLLRALGRIGSPDAFPVLVKFLENGLKNRSNNEDAVDAAEALGQLHLPEAVGPLIKAMTQANDMSVCCASARALGHLGHAEAVQPLESVLADKDPSLRHTAATALVRLGVVRALEMLTADLDLPCVSERSKSAAFCLLELGESAGVEGVCSAISATRDGNTVRGLLGEIAACLKQQANHLAEGDLAKLASLPDPTINGTFIRDPAYPDDCEDAYCPGYYTGASEDASEVRELAKRELQRRRGSGT